MIGAVYFMRAGRRGPIKIGWTRGSVHGRLRVVQLGCAEKIEIIKVIRGCSRSDEAEWHKRFAPNRMYGEWFSPTDMLMQAITAAPIDNRQGCVAGAFSGVARSKKLQGSKLRRHRIEAGETLAEAADKLGVSVSHLSDLERGESRPSVKLAEKLAKKTAIPVLVLLGLERA